MSVLFLRNLRVECRWEPFVVRKWFRHFCFSLKSGWNEPNPFQREITVRRTRATPNSAAHFFVVQPRENWICAQVRHTDRTERERWVLRPDYRVCVRTKCSKCAFHVITRTAAWESAAVAFSPPQVQVPRALGRWEWIPWLRSPSLHPPTHLNRNRAPAVQIRINSLQLRCCARRHTEIN